MKKRVVVLFSLASCAAWYGCASTDDPGVIDAPDSEPPNRVLEASVSEPDVAERDVANEPLDAGADADADAGDADAIDEDPTANPIRSLALGIDVACAVVDTPDRTNVLKCWGYDSSGQVGVGRDGGYAYVAAPTEVVLEDVRKVAVGSDFACAMTADGGLIQCWGSNSTYQLGNGISGRRTSPAPPIVTIGGGLEIAAGKQHACTRLSNGGPVMCWGSNGYGRLGVGDESPRSFPTPLMDPSGQGIFVGQDLALGDSHSCARSASGDAVWCWGWNWYGQLGVATSPDGGTVPAGSRPSNQLVPARVTGLNGTVRQLAAALHDTCALMEDGTVRCWGQCSTGTCKEFMDPPLPEPKPVIDSDTQQPLQGVIKIAGGYSTAFTPELHFCALLTNGTVRCWGSNAHAQLGRPVSKTWTLQATLVPGLSHVTDIAAGSVFTCARIGERRLKCWGDNTRGALGQTAIQPGDDIRPTPQNVGL